MSKNVRKTAWYKGLDNVDRDKIEKLVVDKQMLNDRDSILRSSVSSINQIFQKQLRTVADIRNIFKTLPQLNFPRKILVSSILSPGDITKNELVVKSNLKISDYNLTSQFNRIVQDFVDNELEVNKKVSKWLDDALILEGSHPVMLLPSSVVNAVMGIVESNESKSIPADVKHYVTSGLFKPMGLLGVKSNTGEMISFESSTVQDRYLAGKHPHTITSSFNKKTIDLQITLTDNPSILALPLVNNARMNVRNEGLYGVPSLESMIRYPDANGKPPKFMPNDVRREFFKSTSSKFERVIALPSPKEFANDVNIGHPLEYHLPADSVIPISTPGEPESHSHYIVVTDESGYPVSYGRKMDYYSDIRGSANTNASGTDVAGDMLHMAAENLGVTYKEYTDEAIDQMAVLHSTLVESEVTRSIMAGADGGKVKVEFTDGLSKLMLARTLRNQRTVLLYVPAEYITYFAFDYDEIGVGKSILEDSKSMAAMLSTLTVANVIGSVENAIPGKNLEIKLDPKDRDPLGTATFLTREAMDLNYRRFPMGLNSTAGTAEELQMNAYSVSITGHPAFPEVETNVSSKQSTYQPIDTELMDKLNDFMFLLFSVPAELAGSSNQAEFATTVVANNLMLLKTVIEKQTIWNPLMSDYLRKYVRYSGVMVNRLFQLAESNKPDIPKEYKGDITGFIADYIDHLGLYLPSPETDNLTHQMQLFDNFASNLDKILDSYLNEESLLLEGYKPEVIVTVLPPMREAYKHHCLRQYMRERAIMPDLDIFRADDEDNPTINLNDELKLHSKYVIKSVSGFIKSMSSVLSPEVTDLKAVIKKDAKAKAVADKLNQGTDEEEEVTSDDTVDTGDTVEDDPDALPSDDLNPEESLDDESGEGGTDVPETTEGTEEDAKDEEETGDDPDALPSDKLDVDDL